MNLPEGLHESLRSANLGIRWPDSNHTGKPHFRYDLTKLNELEAAVHAAQANLAGFEACLDSETPG
ncbi:hypothetical protein [Mycobacterium senriense]|uniref:hypothetical protein n=1 Tax=Mycobacterium senriense TaxID=2775496 RepID=UPI001C7FC63D|nr:hypothetical protein [Mycobacterium senriense]